MILLELSDDNLAKYFEECMFTFFPLIFYIESASRFPINNNCLSMTGCGRNALGWLLQNPFRTLEGSLPYTLYIHIEVRLFSFEIKKNYIEQESLTHYFSFV